MAKRNSSISKSIQTTVVPVALVGILFILVLPVPTALLDVFIALNVTISLVVLFASLYVTKPLQFSSFPALLLITTLFRLAMNVATTRLILLDGGSGSSAAGAVIQAFGQFVVGGNFMVGVVVFILISIVNIKVITKGSGRIAEVAARFTLDAMPGKQMAIDSDLNTGLISDDEAKERRKELSMEAEFYGAMDGAAKFVSGDAFAGLFITGINIVGGLFIGILMEKMHWLEAAQTYTLLTIGDGLVSQIPSIIISTSAGLIVARASSGDDLGVELLGQMAQSEKPLFFTSAVSAAFALVPGLPFVPFMVLSVGAATIGFLRKRSLGKEEASEDNTATGVPALPEENAPKPGSTEEVLGLLGMDSLELEIGFELVTLVEGGDLVERIRSIRRQFAIDYGFVIPAIFIRDNVRLKPSEYRLLLRGAHIGGGELMMRNLLAIAPGEVSNAIKGIPTKEPAFGLDALWIPDDEKENAQMVGYTVVDLSTVVTTHLTELIRSHMHELLGRQETQQLIDKVSEKSPKIIEELIPGLLSIGQVRQVLCRLLKEEISIRDIGTILETLADWAGQVKHPEKLAELVRRSLSRTIMNQFTTENGSVPLISLNPDTERLLSDGLQQSDEGTYLALDPKLGQVFISRLRTYGDRFLEAGATPLILAPSHLRAAVFHFVHRYAPAYAVISHNELTTNTRVQSLGVITLNE